jgi:hypothetical protein
LYLQFYISLLNMDKYEVILNPPKEYDMIDNKFGREGFKPTLKYDDKISNIQVFRIIDFVTNGSMSIDDFVENNINSIKYTFGGLPEVGEEPKVDELRDAVKQAIEYHQEYENKIDEFRAEYGNITDSLRS